MRIIRRKPRPVGEKFYSALSGRSSQANSQSNTDSCSQQSSIRYLETEMRRLRESRRPLVVAFRRKQTPLVKTKQVTILDAELQKALDTLSEESKRNSREKTTSSHRRLRKCKRLSHSENSASLNLNAHSGAIELQSLNLSPEISANGVLKSNWRESSVIEVELFRQRQMKFNNVKRSYNKLHRGPNEQTENHNPVITKSNTVPNINEQSRNLFD